MIQNLEMESPGRAGVEACISTEEGEKVPKPKSIHADVPSPPREIKEKVPCKNGKVYIRKYSRGKLLGKGGFARCYELVNTENGEGTSIFESSFLNLWS